MWGPQGNQLGDEPGQMTDNNRALQHFDHNFKGSIHTIKGGTLEESFGACEFAENRNVYISVSAASMEISEEQGWLIIFFFFDMIHMLCDFFSSNVIGYVGVATLRKPL